MCLKHIKRPAVAPGPVASENEGILRLHLNGRASIFFAHSRIVRVKKATISRYRIIGDGNRFYAPWRVNFNSIHRNDSAMRVCPRQAIA
ncbi:MAG: hypothetical protein LBG65_02415 [Puniceicoccales bacterium]|nr:hypothetical protein [Puniceicoccales bacterium]